MQWLLGFNKQMGGWVQLSSAHDWLPSTQCCEDCLHHSPANQSSGHVTAATTTLGNQTMQLFSFRKCEIYFGSLATTVRFLGEQRRRKRFMKKLGINWWFEQLINSRIWEKGTRQWGELTVCFNGILRRNQCRSDAPEG